VDTVELPMIHETYVEKTDVQHGTHFIISTQQFCLMTTSVSTAACGVWTLLAQPSQVASMPSNTQFLHFYSIFILVAEISMNSIMKQCGDGIYGFFTLTNQEMVRTLFLLYSCYAEYHEDHAARLPYLKDASEQG